MEIWTWSPSLYSPDLAPFNFHLFPQMKKALTGHHFASDNVVVDCWKVLRVSIKRLLQDKGGTSALVKKYSTSEGVCWKINRQKCTMCSFLEAQNFLYFVFVTFLFNFQIIFNVFFFSNIFARWKIYFFCVILLAMLLTPILFLYAKQSVGMNSCNFSFIFTFCNLF